MATFNLLQVYAPNAFVTVELQDTNSTVLLNDKTIAVTHENGLPERAPRNLPELMQTAQFKCGAVFVPAVGHVLLLQTSVLPCMVSGS